MLRREQKANDWPEEALWPPGFAAWIKVGVCYQRASRQLAARLREHQLTVAQFDALANLFVESGISQQTLAARLLVTKGNVTGLVDRLVERGWVERRQHPRDGRTYCLHLTRSGKRRARTGLEVQRTMVERMMQPLLAAERESLRQLLTRIAVGLEQHDEPN